MRIDDWEKSFEARPARTSFRLGVTALAVIAGLSVVTGVAGLILAPLKLVTGTVERTLAPDNAIYNYEWFKRQNADIAAMTVKLSSAEQAKTDFEASAGPRDKWAFDDKTEWNRLNTIVLGLRNQRASMVAEYNARSEMANRTIFKTGDLPTSIQ